jgi:hypothetical protein
MRLNLTLSNLPLGDGHHKADPGDSPVRLIAEVCVEGFCTRTTDSLNLRLRLSWVPLVILLALRTRIRSGSSPYSPVVDVVSVGFGNSFG